MSIRGRSMVALAWFATGCAGAPCADLKPPVAPTPAQVSAARAALGPVEAVCRRPYEAQAGVDLYKAWVGAQAALPPGEASQRLLAWELCEENQRAPFDRETWAAFTDDILAREPWMAGTGSPNARLVTFDPAGDVGRQLVDRKGEGIDLLGEVKNCAGLSVLGIMELSGRVESWARRTEDLLRGASDIAADRFRSGVPASSPLEPGCTQEATDLKNKLEWLLGNLRPMIR